MTSLRIKTRSLHLDNGDLAPALVVCEPGKPLEIDLDASRSCDMELPNEWHVALARVDPHTHFRESYLPSREEFEADPFHDSEMAYKSLRQTIERHNRDYDILRGSLAALKGGVWLAGCMGNTPWGPVGEERWRRSSRHYQKQALVYTHVWPRMEPGVHPIAGQEEKDFGSTFGGAGLSNEERRELYLQRAGQRVSYHNDQPRTDETLLEFQQRVQPPDYLLHHLYYDGQTVLQSQRKTLDFALEARLQGLTTRHIPTGEALAMILQAREWCDMELRAEAGLDYLYFNREMLSTRATRMINYRRPALPSREEQQALIELTLKCARRRDGLTFIGSDHAPHSHKNKQFTAEGLPGAPGTRLLEHTHQVLMNLRRNHGYTYFDLDWLSAIAPAQYIAQFRSFPYTIGTMQSGGMANLVVFHPDENYTVCEETLRRELKDPEYHTAYRDEALRGKVYFTVVNGVVFDVAGEIVPVNAEWAELDTFYQPGIE